MKAKGSNISRAATPKLAGMSIAGIPGLKCLSPIRKRRGREEALTAGKKNQSTNQAFMWLQLEALATITQVKPAHEPERIARDDQVSAGLRSRLVKVVPRKSQGFSAVGDPKKPKVLRPAIARHVLPIGGEPGRVVLVALAPAKITGSVPHLEVLPIFASEKEQRAVGIELNPA
jgi:hypothetical protein